MKIFLVLMALSLLCISPAKPPIKMKPDKPQQEEKPKQQDKPKKSDREKEGLRGLVKTFREEWCGLSASPDQSGKYKELVHQHVRTLTFDKAGNIIKKYPLPYSCATGALVEAMQRYERIYDERGNLLEVRDFNKDGELHSKYTYKYDSEGSVIELAYYVPDKLVYKWQHEFDSNGNEIKTIHYTGDTLDRVEEMSYNDEGLIIEYTIFDGKGNLKEKEVTTYEDDAHGNWVKSTDSRLVTENGNSFYKPVRVDFQILTYYPEPSAKAKHL